MKLKPISEQVAVVMGASSGLGRETALEMARRGARVVASARSEDALGTLVEDIRAAGGEAVAIPADVTDFAQVKAVAGHAVQTYGRIDTWAQLSSVSVYGFFTDIEPEEFRRVIDVNLTGAAFAAKAAIPELAATGGGAFIGVTSIVAQRGIPLLSAYSAAKHGFAGFMEALRLELKRQGLPVSVTNIMPSAMNTPFFSKARTRLGVQPKGTPPIYDPAVAVQAILYAAQNPVRDLVAGGANQPLLLLQRISPLLADAVLYPWVFRAQQSDEPKPVEAPDNLFEPVRGEHRIEGDYPQRAKHSSAYTWMETHPVVSRLALGVGLGAAAALATQALGGRRPHGGNGRGAQADERVDVLAPEATERGVPVYSAPGD